MRDLVSSEWRSVGDPNDSSTFFFIVASVECRFGELHPPAEKKLSTFFLLLPSLKVDLESADLVSLQCCERDKEVADLEQGQREKENPPPFCRVKKLIIKKTKIRCE